MHFDGFSFGALRIDGSTYEQDVVIDRGKSANARRHLPRDSGTSLDMHSCPSRKRYAGNAAGL
jgi:hypothetical protein